MAARVKEGDWCIINVNEGSKYIVVEVKQNGTIRMLKKKTFPCSKLIGHLYGDFLELGKDGQVTVWDGTKEFKLDAPKFGEDFDSITGDNRNVKRNAPGTQKLSFQDIEEMKKDNEVHGTEMIEKVAAANAVFQEKTIFAKEKYLLKKRKKHLSVFQIIRPTSRTIAEAYFNHGIAKIYFVRPDSLAQILSLANITADNNVMIFETCAGLIVGSVLERLGGHGNVISVYQEQTVPVNNALKCFNFPEQIGKGYIPVPFYLLDLVANSSLQDFTTLPDSFIFKNCKNLATLHRARQVLEEPVDSLIIVSKYDPPEVLLELFKYVRGSGHIVIFHQYLEPLVQCHEMLRDSGEAVNIELRELWFRDFQVLPLRTHPMMNMHGASGYMLSAIKVLYSSDKENKKNRPRSKKQRTN